MGHPSAFNPNVPHPSDRQLQLVVHAGPLAGKGFPITKDTLTIGRDPDNDITLDDEQVSRHHARLLRQEDQIIIEDFGSTNGTLVNGKAVVGQHVLQPADIISIGSSVFGVKGFAAPLTIGMTQLSSEPPPYLPPVPRPPSRPATPVSTVPDSRPVGAEPSKVTLLAIGGVLALVIGILIVAAFTAYYMLQGRDTAASVPQVVITAPTSGSQVPVNRPVTIQATASDPSGVSRMELWVSGQKFSEANSPVPGQATLTASFQWTPAAPGSYTLEIRAYNQQGAVNAPAIVTVNAVAEGVTETPTPTLTLTPTPGTPTPTVPNMPALVTKTDLNVRGGPGTQYDLLGLLPTGTTAEIISRDDTRQWWQIRFPPAPNDVGWVSADPAFSTVFNVENVPVVAAPPTPTGTSTTTPTTTNTPTFTPTPTSTPTDTPTPTPTGEAEIIEFNVKPTTIEGGECVVITWNVSGVKEVYLNDQGVGGTGSMEDCPKDTKTYRLRVVRKDGSEFRQEITVQVINPIASTGVITVQPNQTVDFDDGVIPGDDFTWKMEADSRKFEVLGGVQLAPMSQIGALDDLSRAECANAAYGAYTFIDASDVIPDPNNALTPGRSACYRTNQGRLGKLRFPEYSAGSLRVEWLTWK
ncbi:MAG: FHA domain-containing protein [Anaerolineae bacterium]|nr:FHA domain-containing protein [Anaerolineae bacterium]